MLKRTLVSILITLFLVGLFIKYAQKTLYLQGRGMNALSFFTLDG